MTPTPAQRVAAAAAKYDNEWGELTASSLRRLERRQATAGKTCSACQLGKPFSAFGPDGRKADGFRKTCRECEARVARERRAKRSGS